MTNAFYNTSKLLRSLARRDAVRLSLWLLLAVSFAISGMGKMGEFTGSPESAALGFAMFQNPAMIALMGPTAVEEVSGFTTGAAFGQSMVLLTVLFLAVLSVTYVINRTRKEEDEGLLEIFRSFQMGRLSNSSAVVIEMFILHLLIAFSVLLTMQVMNVDGLNEFSANLLFASIIASQGFMWAMIALFLAQIFPDAGTAKGFGFGLLGGLYVLRMAYDMSNPQIGWFNPLSWSYLTDIYVKDNWLPVFLSLIFAFLMLLISYQLELNRDLNSGYLPERKGRQHARKSLLTFPGLSLHTQKLAIISWLSGIFILALVYGSLFGQIDEFIESNEMFKQIFTMPGMTSMTDSFLSTILIVMSLLVACMSLQSLLRLVSEERKNRLEQLYAMKLSRLKIYSTHVSIAIGITLLGQFISALGLWLSQASVLNDPIPFTKIFAASMTWTVPLVFILAFATLLMAYFPRFSSFSWFLVGYGLFDSYLGRLINLSEKFSVINIFSYIPKLPVEEMSWGNVSVILILSLFFFIFAFLGYKKRDLIMG